MWIDAPYTMVLLGGSNQTGLLGFEPNLFESKSNVLPLHHSPKGRFHAHIQKIANKYATTKTNTVMVVLLFFEISDEAKRIRHNIAIIVVTITFTANIKPPLLSKRA